MISIFLLLLRRQTQVIFYGDVFSDEIHGNSTVLVKYFRNKEFIEIKAFESFLEI